jgi:hypothetical protein
VKQLARLVGLLVLEQVEIPAVAMQNTRADPADLLSISLSMAKLFARMAGSASVLGPCASITLSRIARGAGRHERVPWECV